MRCLLATLVVATALGEAVAKEFANSEAREQANISSELPFHELPPVDVGKLLAEDQMPLKMLEGRVSPPVRIAAPANADPFTFEDFTWRATKSGYLGLLKLRSKNALAQSIQITRFDMPEGSKLWISDPDRKYPAGPYLPTRGHQNPAIWTPAVAGEELVVTIESQEQPRRERDGLEIRTVMQTYRGIAAAGVVPQVGPSGATESACQKDVCKEIGTPPNQELAKAARAVTVFTVSKGSGVYACTGTLLNNLSTPREDYILSAYHCIGILADTDNSPAALANSITFYFDMAADCSNSVPHNGGPPSSSYPMMTGGAQIKASWPRTPTPVETDFMLLLPNHKEIALPAGSTYSPYHAGWDASGNAPGSAFGLHHPKGDVMAYSASSSAPIQVEDNFTTACATGTPGCNHWYVPWTISGNANEGTGTEPGSSGSCLFDSTSMLCVGMLWGPGGGADTPKCNGTTTAAVTASQYGMFSASWNPTGLSATSGACATASATDKEKGLRCWLDPNDTLIGAVPKLQGDTHIMTINGALYHFQAVGDFVALRGPGGFEVQTRQSAVTTDPHLDPTTNLNLCVSINTAVAARVGTHRVSYQPKSGSVPNPSSPQLELRIDDILTPLGAHPIELEGGGRIIPQGDRGNLQIQFPDRHLLTVTADWWNNVWYLNLDIQRALAIGGTENVNLPFQGLAGPIAPGDWLPAQPDGSSMGPLPPNPSDRYDPVYAKFANAWRVSPGTSLFASATTTDIDTLPSWPQPQGGRCIAPRHHPDSTSESETPPDAKAACSAIEEAVERQNCEFDVRVSKNPGVARGYEASQRIRAGGVIVTVEEIKSRHFWEPTYFRATVRLTSPTATAVPTGTVTFLRGGKIVSKPTALDSNGQAHWHSWCLKDRQLPVSATYAPSTDRHFLPGTSAELLMTTREYENH